MANSVDGSILVEQKVRFKDEQGRFRAEVDAACVASSEQLAQMVAHLAEQAAWDDSGPILAESHGFSATATALGRTAAIQEFGARAHVIANKEGPQHPLSNRKTGFFSEHAVMHPGVRARHFLSDAGAAASRMAPALIARNFPK